MNKQLFRARAKRLKSSLGILGILILMYSCHKPDVDPAPLRNFKQVNLVANTDEYHPVTVDPTLINGFGMAWSSNGFAWVNSVGGHVSEIYTADGAIARPPVNIPSPSDSVNGLPTGIVFSGGKNFNLSNGSSVFLFTGFDGVLSGWNPASGDFAKRIRNPQNASFTGLTLAANGNKNFIYAANFGANKIDVWDTAFNKVSMSFVDPSIPSGYSPYNIQSAGNVLFVMYARLGTNGLPVGGEGTGFVSIFSTDGAFIRRFASQGSLDIPWGLATAPASFLSSLDLGKDDHGYNGYSGSGNNSGGDKNERLVFVGNFGDGRINVYSIDGQFLGQLQSNRNPIEIDGLWALTFAPPGSNVDPSRLYFTAGPRGETDGLFGYLIKQ